MRASLTTSAVVLSIGIYSAGCEWKRIEGTYADVTGTIVLELKRDGVARYTEPRRSEQCRYRVNVDTIPVTCPAGEHLFAIGQDGSLTTPNVPGTLKRMP